MTQPNAQAAPSTERPRRVLWPHAFETDYAGAECFGAGELLQSLYNIIEAVHAADGMLQEEPDRAREQLAIVNQQATKSYRELMCTVGAIGTSATDVHN